MHQLKLIIQREYWTRVRRRSFLIATFITPLAFGVFAVIVNYILQYKSDEAIRIAVVDEGGLFKGGIADEANVYFKPTDQPLATLREGFAEAGYHGILVTPSVGGLQQSHYVARYYTNQKLTLELEPILTQRIRAALRKHKVALLQIDEATLSALNSTVDIEPVPVTKEAIVGTSLAGKIAAVIGMVMAFFMYTTVFIYGMMVMRSVMEEKTNRIVEVMVSSVKPFPLMLGKIIGVGLVGLTQVLAWVILLPLMLVGVNLFFGIEVDPHNLPETPPELADIDPEVLAVQIMAELGSFNWWLILPLFLLYFLGGYFMYAALFAAVGSAMGDDLGEGQSLTIPITIPVILAFYITIAAIQSPNSGLAIGASLFPLFSPIVMPARLPFDPPWWEVAVSLLLLAATCVALVWLSGRIYRVGILLYGKKTTLLEMGRWIFRK
ncbi:MAG: ABC transporter permease [Saprospiraceae bacterium]